LIEKDPMTLIFATRPSALARWQTQWVMAALQQLHPGLECIEKVITTQGDRILDRPLPEIGGKGVFTQELEEELLSGRVQAAVHSLKDLPVENPPGLVIGCIPARAEVRDALISAHGYTLQTLPEGAVVGTSSLRRAAQLLIARPDLQTASLRGNVDTRLRKALDGQYDAIILAGAGLQRLGLGKYVTQYLPLDIMLPAPGQGALAVQCRADDAATLQLFQALEDPTARCCTAAERAFLLALGGGCSAPVAAYASTAAGQMHLTGLVSTPAGKSHLLVETGGADPLEVGQELAVKALALGAGKILRQSMNASLAR
jgi:hydroxymethylbilane synthase